MNKIDKIRKILNDQIEKENRSKGKSTGPSANFPFWNMATGGTTTIRFLPDGNEENDLFWVERMMINLEFPGIKGEQSTGYNVMDPTIECL